MIVVKKNNNNCDSARLASKAYEIKYDRCGRAHKKSVKEWRKKNAPTPKKRRVTRANVMNIFSTPYLGTKLSYIHHCCVWKSFFFLIAISWVKFAFGFLFYFSYFTHGTFLFCYKNIFKKLFLVTRGRQRIIETRESYFLLLFGSKVQPFPSHRSFFVSIHSSSSICNIQMHENIYICRQRLTFPSYTEPGGRPG